MRAFLVHLRQLLRRGRAILLGLLPVVLAALVLCVALAVSAGAALGGEEFEGLALAVVDEDGEAQQMLQSIGNTPGLRAWVRLRFAATREEAGEWVHSGEASAALVLPAGFMQGVMSGENLPPVLILNEGAPLASLLVSAVSESLLSMLVTAQGGMGAVAVNGGDSVALGLQYALWVLDRGSLYTLESVTPTGALPLGVHYLLGAVLLFAMLCVPLLYRSVSLRENAALRGRLRVGGQGQGAFAMAQLCFAALYMLLLIALLLGGASLLAWLLGLRLRMRLALVPGLLLCALLLGAWACFVNNLGGVLHAVCVSLVGTLAVGYVSGALLPPALLPAALGKFTVAGPFAWMRTALAPIAGYAGTAALLPLAVYCFVATGVWLLAAEGRRKQ